MEDNSLDKYIKYIEINYKILLTDTEVCKILGFTKSHFCQKRNSEKILPFIKIGSRIRYLKDDVIDYLKKNRVL